ncbi:hypothetical protein V6N12_053286 [Hibiscus sabdariffa]|uniref:PHD finger protein ALFIN-LIKE n=1 Tax=Hibiscus sabdariffa TaxID=183260 RepID=A0ABR2D750_9ROSI
MATQICKKRKDPAVEKVFLDFKGCRAGIIKALTTDVEELYRQCDPALATGVEEFYRQCDPENKDLCLYGYPSEKFSFGKATRKCLFNMINDLPTIFEVVTGVAKKQTEKKSSVSNDSSNKSKSNVMDEEEFRETVTLVSYYPRTVEEVFWDFKGRRAGMIKALTTDVKDFYQQCNPEKENLGLYGFPSEQWELDLPAGKLPPELPEPTMGINFARDGMLKNDWLSMVAVHSDMWLLSVAFCFGARLLFDKADRKRLFNMINDLPTITEQQSYKSNSKFILLVVIADPKYSKPVPPKGDDVDDREDEELRDALCGACGENNGADEFWICCDICFHGKGVNITPARI